MATRAVTVADLSRDPEAVARALPAWVRGDADEAARETLRASSTSLFGRAYTCWVWTGRTEDDAPAWALPVTGDWAAAYHPSGPAAVLRRCLAAAVATGADPEAVALEDWRGYACLVLPGADEELAACALEEAHPTPHRVGVAELPNGTPLGGRPLPLGRLGPRDGDGLVALARATRVHPVRVALVLLGKGQSLEEQSYPAEMVRALRDWGCEGPLEPTTGPSLAIEDDPCPRRRHARRVLQRLMRMKKIGDQHHTEFDHLYRGAAPEQRKAALEVGEALIRAGLLGEKPSVGQRHVYLRREALPRIHALINRGATDDPALACRWTAPAPEESAP
jgi:hypothetical protein